jgi:hypothetical protein
MKHRTLIESVVIAAASLTMLLSASFASANTTMCKTALETCPATGHYTAGTIYHYSLSPGTEMAFNSGFVTFRCTESSATLEQTSTGGGSGSEANVRVALKALSFGNCFGTFTVKKLGTGEIAWTSGSNGNITGSGTELEVIWGSTKCFYGGSIPAGLTLEGASSARLKAVNIELTREAGSSALCANPSKINASYTAVMANASVWVAHS